MTMSREKTLAKVAQLTQARRDAMLPMLSVSPMEEEAVQFPEPEPEPEPEPAVEYEFTELSQLHATVSEPTERIMFHPLDIQTEEKKDEQVIIPAQRGPNRLIVASYNVRCDSDGVPFRWIDRMPHVMDAIRQSGAHVVCLQEARDQYSRDMQRQLGTWTMSGVPRRRYDEGTQVLFNRDTVVYMDSRTFVLSDDNGPKLCPPASPCDEKSMFRGHKCAHVRIFTHTSLRDKRSGRFLHVINTHFPLELHEQMICAEQISAYVNAEIPQNCTLLLCGDFNSHYSPADAGTPLQVFLSRIPGLSDCHGMADFPTFAGGFMAEDLGKEPIHRLDYIFIRGGELLSSDMVPARYGTNNSLRPSDHELIRAELVV